MLYWACSDPERSVDNVMVRQFATARFVSTLFAIVALAVQPLDLSASRCCATEVAACSECQHCEVSQPATVSRRCCSNRPSFSKCECQCKSTAEPLSDQRVPSIDAAGVSSCMNLFDHAVARGPVRTLYSLAIPVPDHNTRLAKLCVWRN